MYRTIVRPTFACLPMRNGLGWVPVVALLAVVTVSTGGEVAALEADTTRDSTRQLVQLHVEPATTGVAVAITC